MGEQEFVMFADNEMRFRILHAVDRSLEKITVAQICENAGVSRNTFYRYFDSKYDIPTWHGRYCQLFYLNEVGRTIDWRTGYFHDFRLLSEERAFYRHALDYTVYSSEGLQAMEDHRRAVIHETLCDYRHVKVDGCLAFCIDTFVRTETEVMAEWLRNEFEPAPSVFVDYMLAIVPERLYHAMDLSADAHAERR